MAVGTNPPLDTMAVNPPANSEVPSSPGVPANPEASLGEKNRPGDAADATDTTGPAKLPEDTTDSVQDDSLPNGDSLDPAALPDQEEEFVAEEEEFVAEEEEFVAEEEEFVAEEEEFVAEEEEYGGEEQEYGGEGEPYYGEGEEYEDVEEEDTWETRRERTPLDVQVTWHNYEYFKNRYSPEDGMAIIQVLRGHQHINQEITKETTARSRSHNKSRAPGPTKLVVDADDCWIQRIRIQSPQLICLLSRLTGHRDGWATDRPRVFFQPFRIFYYFLPQMRECLKILEAKWEKSQPSPLEESLVDDHIDEPGQDPHVPQGSDASSMTSDDSDGSSDDGFADNVGPMDPVVAITGDLVDSPTALSHVRKYVEFVEEHIVPKWELAGGTTKRKARFNDLWMSFKPGEVLYMPPASDSDQSFGLSKQHAASKKMYQNAWALYSMVLSSVKDDIPDDAVRLSKRCLDLHCYYLDYDGTSYIPVRHMFCIKDFEDERDITSFEIYPMRFVKNSEKIVANLRQEGGWFRDAIVQKHLFYDGWTLPYGPTADAPSSDTKEAPNIPTAPIEHVEGDVIIDFVEGFKSEPALGPGPSSWSQGLRDFNDSDWPMGEDDIAIKHWERSPDGGLRFLGDIREKSQRGEWFCEKMKNDHLESRASLKAHKAGTLVTTLEDDELVLLPRRVVAYAFRERKFALLDIRSLRLLPASESVFKDLKIDDGHKLMVKSLVKAHLKKQVAQKKRPNINLNQDLIRGKGSGLFILLHGVPGVGKTATAEAVAQANKKPLFSITCGDLGFSPKEIETALREIFRLAHHWDCVLLLDEADIFLSRRELGDLKRNALVSVFLRVLEYYSGILFLTTNRVGTLDEAFKSRIHVSLYYPPLTRDQTLAIFDVNIRKLREIEEEHALADVDSTEPKRPPLFIDRDSILHYARWHFEVNKSTPQQRWNGRQIRNAFQIAYSLAHFDMQKNSIDRWGEDEDDDEHPNTAPETRAPPTSLTLNSDQFNMVGKTIKKFEDYLYEATGTTDKDRAAIKKTRADDFDPHKQDANQEYQRLPEKYDPAYIFPDDRRPSVIQPSHQPTQAKHRHLPPRRGNGPSQQRPAHQQQAPPQTRLAVPGPPSHRNTSPQSRTSPVLHRGKPRTQPAQTFPLGGMGRAVNPPAGSGQRSDSGYSTGWTASPGTPWGNGELEEEAVEGGYMDYAGGDGGSHYAYEDDGCGEDGEFYDARDVRGYSGEYVTR